MECKKATLPKRRLVRVFMTGNSKAGCLPQEFRFDTEKVAIRREGNNVILSPPCKDWTDCFERAPRVGEDFITAMEEMRCNTRPLEERDLFD